MAKVSLRRLEKQYDTFHAVRGVDLDIGDQEFVVLVGPSGCGKSTTLRMLAGLEDATAGEIEIGDRVVNDLSPAARNVAMVFQNYALYPHMTVRANIAFGLQQRRMPKAEIDKRVNEVVEMLRIESLLSRKPRALSGGQRQRVAIGRAIVRRPDVFLFDEPLSNLDAALRVQMRTEIKRLHLIEPTTTVYVTHDQVEAMTMADRIVVMDKGLIEQVGTPYELYHQPRTRFVAGFIGSPAMNFFDVDVEGAGEGLSVRFANGDTMTVPAKSRGSYGRYAGKKMILGIRPEHLNAQADDSGPIHVKVNVVEPLGQTTLVYFSLGDEYYAAHIDPRLSLAVNASLTLTPDPQGLHLIDPRTDIVINSID